MVLQVLRHPSLLNLEYKESQIDVLCSQKFVTFHRVYDGQGHVFSLVILIGEDKVVDDWMDFDIVVGAFKQQKGAFHGRINLAF